MKIDFFSAIFHGGFHSLVLFSSLLPSNLFLMLHQLHLLPQAHIIYNSVPFLISNLLWCIMHANVIAEEGVKQNNSVRGMFLTLSFPESSIKRSGTTICHDENIRMSGYQVKQWNCPTEPAIICHKQWEPQKRKKLYEVEVIICLKICL